MGTVWLVLKWWQLIDLKIGSKWKIPNVWRTSSKIMQSKNVTFCVVGEWTKRNRSFSLSLSLSDLNDKNQFNYVEHIQFCSSVVIILLYSYFFAFLHWITYTTYAPCEPNMRVDTPYHNVLVVKSFRFGRTFLDISLRASMQMCDLMWI